MKWTAISRSFATPEGHKISIVVPVYNVEYYLEACIRSIISQTYKNIEIILVDDGSKDRSGDICDLYAQKDLRIKVIHQINAGVSTARNEGIKIALGEYICFVDSDDKLKPDFLENFCLGYDISIQGYVSELNGKESPVSYRNLSSSKDVSKVYCLNDIHSGPVSKLCRTNIIKEHEILFPQDVSFSEDTIFFLNYIRYCHSISVSSACGYVYQKREGSLSNTRHDIAGLMEKEEVLYSLYNKLFDDATFKKKFFHELCLFILYKYYFFEGVNPNYVKNSFLGKIARNHLNQFEEMLLKVSYSLFCNYALWRRRIKRHILRPVLHRYETTLLNV